MNTPLSGQRVAHHTPGHPTAHGTATGTTGPLTHVLFDGELEPEAVPTLDLTE